jgi:predicted ester cyclase
MSVEQVAREFITKMNDMEEMKRRISPDAVASGGVLPQPIPAMEALKMMSGLTNAFPDLKFDIQKVTVNGDQATVTLEWGGTQSGPMSFPIPGMPSIPPTGKKVSVQDIYVITVKDDKVSRIQVESPAGGGIPGALVQLGVKMPAM